MFKPGDLSKLEQKIISSAESLYLASGVSKPTVAFAFNILSTGMITVAMNSYSHAAGILVGSAGFVRSLADNYLDEIVEKVETGELNERNFLEPITSKASSNVVFSRFISVAPVGIIYAATKQDVAVALLSASVGLFCYGRYLARSTSDAFYDPSK